MRLQGRKLSATKSENQTPVTGENLASREPSETRFLFGFLLLAGLLAFAVRILPHAPNFTPMGAFALFAGAYLAPKFKWAFFLPLLVMFLSDIFIGFYDLKLMAVVYAGFLLYAAIGVLVSKKRSAAAILLGSIGGAVFFYLTTNFAVWAFSSWYPHTLEGLLLSYTLALPFFRATLLGDIVFTGIFFGVYAFAKNFLLDKRILVSPGLKEQLWKTSKT